MTNEEKLKAMLQSMIDVVNASRTSMKHTFGPFRDPVHSDETYAKWDSLSILTEDAEELLLEVSST